MLKYEVNRNPDTKRYDVSEFDEDKTSARLIDSFTTRKQAEVVALALAHAYAQGAAASSRPEPPRYVFLRR